MTSVKCPISVKKAFIVEKLGQKLSYFEPGLGGTSADSVDSNDSGYVRTHHMFLQIVLFVIVYLLKIVLSICTNNLFYWHFII